VLILFYIVPHNLLYFMFEFQPIAKHPRVERRGRIHVKSKVNNETGGKEEYSLKTQRSWL